MPKKRNSSIDIFRLVAAAAVVIQHYGVMYPRTGTLSMLFNLFSRIAVPFFFMVSGYFSWKDSPEKRQASLKAQACAIAKILAVSCAVIMLFNYFFGYKIPLRTVYWRRLVLFNEPNFLLDQSHMWYMLALIYVLLIALAVEKLRLHKAAYISAPILLLAAVGLELYLRATGLRHACYTRNFLFSGLPYFYIGQIVRRYGERVEAFFTKKRCIALFSLSVAGLAAEAVLALKLGLASFDITFDRSAFVFLPPLGLSILLLLLKFPDIGRGSFFARYARDASMIIYIIQHIVEEIIKIIAAALWNVEMFRHATARYFLILLIAGTVGFGYAVIVERLRRSRKPSN